MAPPKDPDRAALKKQQQEERKRISRALDPYWKKGMHSANSEIVPVAITTTGITGQDVKSYIARKKRKVKYASLKASGQLPQRTNKVREKKVRGYDKFRSSRMREPDLKNLSSDEQGKKMRIVTAEWLALPKEEKQKWNELAKKDNENFKAPSRKGRRILKKVKNLCKELWEVGVVATLLLPPGQGVKTAISVHHPPEMKPFWDAQMMDPVLMGFGEQIKRFEALYLMRQEAEAADTLESQVIQKEAERDAERTEVPEISSSSKAIGEPSVSGVPVGSVVLGPIVDVQDVVTVSIVHGENEQILPIHDYAATPMDSTQVQSETSAEIHLGDAIQNILGNHTDNKQNTNVTNEVIDLECKSAMEAFNNAKALAKNIEKKAAKGVEQKENKKVKRKAKLVGKQIQHLWAMSNNEKSWFDGVIVSREGEQYMIRYEDDKALVPMPVKEFQKFRRNKTLIFK